MSWLVNWLAKKYGWLLRHETLLIVFGLWIFMKNQWIAEDGYIYFAYVWNFLAGDGAVYNLGEKVEGFTSPAWFLLLSAVGWLGQLFGVGLRICTLLLSHIIVLVTMIAIVRVNDRAVERASESSTSPKLMSALKLNIPLALFVSFTVTRHFATSGLETPLVMLYCVLCASLILRGDGKGWHAYALLAVAPWIRPDMVLIGIAPVLENLIRERRILWKPSLAVVASWVVLEIGRIWYYAALLPNTYYAKTGIPGVMSQGVRYLRDLMHAYGIQWLLVIVIFAVFLRQLVLRDRSDYRRRWLLLGTAAVYGAYVVKIGGDFMHGRFWLPSLLLLFLALAGQGGLLLGAMFSSPTRDGEGSVYQAKYAQGARWVILLVIVLVGSFQEPAQTANNPLKQTMFAGISNERQALKDGRKRRLDPWRYKNKNRFAQYGRGYRRLSKLMDREIGGAHGGIGQPGYYGRLGGGRAYILDLLGLTQPMVAGLKPHEAFKKRRIGHKKLAPGVWVALHPRMTFGWPYFDGYGKTFSVEAYGKPILDLSLLAPGDGLRPTAEEVKRMKAYIHTSINRDQVDANLVYFFHRRYQHDDALRVEIEDAYRRLPRKSRWEAWFDENAEALAHIDRQIYNKGAFFENIGIAFGGHFKRPRISFLKAEPDWVDLAAKR